MLIMAYSIYGAILYEELQCGVGVHHLNYDTIQG